MQDYPSAAQSLGILPSGGVRGGGPQDRKPRQCEQETNELESAVQSLSVNVDCLLALITPIARAHVAEVAPSSPDEYLVPVAERLRDIRRRVQVVDSLVRDMTTRVEL